MSVAENLKTCNNILLAYHIFLKMLSWWLECMFLLLALPPRLSVNSILLDVYRIPHVHFHCIQVCEVIEMNIKGDPLPLNECPGALLVAAPLISWLLHFILLLIKKRYPL